MNYVGELGWELHHPVEYQNHIFDALMEAGGDLGLAPFGIRAMDSMRFEKSYRMGTELSIEYAALESELGRFVHLNKGDFAPAATPCSGGWSADSPTGSSPWRCTTPTDADALGNNPLFVDGELVGRATGGSYGFRVGKSLALAMVRAGARGDRHRGGDGHPGHDAPGRR